MWACICKLVETFWIRYLHIDIWSHYCLFKRKKREYMKLFVKPKISFKMKPVQNALGCFNEQRNLCTLNMARTDKTSRIMFHLAVLSFQQNTEDKTHSRCRIHHCSRLKRVGSCTEMKFWHQKWRNELYRFENERALWKIVKRDAALSC